MTDFNTDKKAQKTPKIFQCTNCYFICSKKSDYNRHIATQKHKRLINTDGCATFTPFHCNCGKKYKHSQSLYNHKKKCHYKENKMIEYANKNVGEEENVYQLIDNEDNQQGLKDLVVQLITENNEIKNTLLKENKELRNQIFELIPQIGNNNTTNNVKQRFNINVFLNEKCKDAISMDQFIEKIEVSMKNLLTTKDKGLGEGLSNIIIDNMNKLSLYERPMHCTDKKRETLYVKNEEWQKDENQELINSLLKKVEHKQMKNIKQWTENHPDYMEDEKLQVEYIDLIRKCTSSVEGCKEKVIKKVCDNVYLTEKE